jgi:hypothetical protein
VGLVERHATLLICNQPITSAKKAQAILQREFLVERQSLSGTVDGAQRVTTLKKKIHLLEIFFNSAGTYLAREACRRHWHR